MYARVVTVQVQAGKMDEMLSIFRDSVVPAAKEQTGFKGIFALTDTDTNKAISIALWETEADMKAGEASGYLNEQIATLAHTFAGAPTTERYEVSVQA